MAEMVPQSGGSAVVSGARLYVALELSATKWKLAMSAAGGDKVREREVEAGDVDGLMRELDRGASGWSSRRTRRS
jgi:hypothetical protein